MRKLRSTFLVVCVAVVAMLALPATAFADHFQGGEYLVTYNANDQWEDNYSDKEFIDQLRLLQPGDDVTLRVNMKHENATACDWYMENLVWKTLEEAQNSGLAGQYASGSVYSYLLTYTNPSGVTTTLFDSDNVGGDRDKTDPRSGLFGATDYLDDWFFLDTLSKGQTAHVDLVVSMDGETEGNAYFDTIAQLELRFAVEKNTTSTTPPTGSNRNIVVTGDDTNLMPFYVVMVVSGVLLLILGFVSLRARKREKEGGVR